MRSEFERWASEYPGRAGAGSAEFEDLATARFLKVDLPTVIRAAPITSLSLFTVRTSVGQGGWTSIGDGWNARLSRLTQ